MVLPGSLLLALVLPTAATAAPIGESFATVTITPSGDGVTTVIEVETDPEVTRRREMTFFMNLRGVDDRTRSVILPPSQPGRYRFEAELTAGAWNITLRYGLGLDLYYAFVLADIDPQRAGGAPLRRGLAFEGDLGDEVPPLVQPLGFAVFGLVAVVALALVAAVLRGLRLAEL